MPARFARRLTAAYLRKPLLAAAAVIAAAALAPAAASASFYTPTLGSAFFSSTSFFNTPLPSNTQIVANSPQLVSTLQQAVQSATPWINTTSYSSPIYTVTLAQPNVYVTLNEYNPPLQSAFAAVPIPLGAAPAPGTDGHMVVYQPSTDTMWEFWRAYTDSSGNWHASYGGKMTNVSQNGGVFPNQWGATASSLPLAGGMMTIQDLANGVTSGTINHAIAFAMPHPKANTYVWPATRTDGDNTSANAVPEGQRFRLPANLNIAALNLPTATAEIARAAQTYGIILRDTAGAVVMYGEDPSVYETTSGGWNPYGYLFQGVSPATIMQDFPWSKLQAVAPNTP